jgi:hypothetical protein
MDGLSKLSREAQFVLGGGVLLLILSFFPWQQASVSIYSVSFNEWHGIGFLAGLLVIAMLVWEVLRLRDASVSLGSLSPGLVSFGFAALTVIFTVIAFLDKSAFRNWPAWIALFVALGVGAAAVMRGRAEGVEMPKTQPAGAAASAEPAGPAGPAEPASSTDSADEPTE